MKIVPREEFVVDTPERSTGPIHEHLLSWVLECEAQGAYERQLYYDDIERGALWMECCADT